MKICILTERMLRGFGVDLVVHKTAEGLVEHGFHVEIICNHQDGSYLGNEYELIQVPTDFGGSPVRYEQNTYKKVGSLLDDYDLILVETFPYFYTAHMIDKPWIAVDHGVVPTLGMSFRKKREFDYIKRTQYGKYMINADAIVCVSNFLKTNLNSELEKKSVVIHNGIDHYAFPYKSDIKKILNTEGLVILYIGRSIDKGPYKNTNKLINIFNQLKGEFEINLLMISPCGDLERKRLESQGVFIIQNLLPEFLPSIYQGSDIYATTTLWEGFNLPLLEASYFGLPVIAYDIGPHSEIVKRGESGFLASSDEQFSKQLSKLIKNKDIRAKMGKEGKGFASNFKWEKAIKEYVKLIEQISFA